MKPGWPRVLALLALLSGCASSPCSFRNPSYAEHVAACDARIGAECKLDENRRPVADCPALIECKTWARQTCSEGAQ